MRKYTGMSSAGVRDAVEERTLGMWRLMWVLRVVMTISGIVAVVMAGMGRDDVVLRITVPWMIGFVLLIRHELIVLTLMMLPRTDAE